LTLQGSASQENLTIDSGLSYQSDKHVFNLDVNSQYSSQKKANNTRQQTLSTGLYSRIRETNWYQGGLINLLSTSLTDRRISRFTFPVLPMTCSAGMT
jgi:hypothetical protein